MTVLSDFEGDILGNGMEPFQCVMIAGCLVKYYLDCTEIKWWPVSTKVCCLCINVSYLDHKQNRSKYC